MNIRTIRALLLIALVLFAVGFFVELFRNRKLSKELLLEKVKSAKQGAMLHNDIREVKCVFTGFRGDHSADPYELHAVMKNGDRYNIPLCALCGSRLQATTRRIESEYALRNDIRLDGHA